MNAGLASKKRFVIVLGSLTGLAALTIDMSLPAIPAMARALSTDLSSGMQIVGIFMAGLAIGYAKNRMDHRVRSRRAVRLCHAIYDCLG